MNVQTMSRFFALLTVGANLFVVGTVVLWLWSRTSPHGRRIASELHGWIAPAALPLAWIVGLVATGGSLYYSEVAGYVPCTLCWYQRIAAYPMSLLLGIATFRRDTSIRRYAIPLAAAGAVISVYHYQLQRFPSQASFSCAESAPCALTYVWQFHYISIPFMALSASALIITLLALATRPFDEEVEPAQGRARELQEASR